MCILTTPLTFYSSLTSNDPVITLFSPNRNYHQFTTYSISSITHFHQNITSLSSIHNLSSIQSLNSSVVSSRSASAIIPLNTKINNQVISAMNCKLDNHLIIFPGYYYILSLYKVKLTI